MLFPKPEWKKVVLSLVGSAILAFGLYQVHAQADVTEGGILGISLLLDHWFGICYAQCHDDYNAPCSLLLWRDQSGGHSDKSFDIVDHQFHFLWNYACMPAGRVLSRAGILCGTDHFVADSLCFDHREITGLFSAGCGVYRQHLCGLLADPILYSAAYLLPSE